MNCTSAHGYDTVRGALDGNLTASIVNCRHWWASFGVAACGNVVEGARETDRVGKWSLTECLNERLQCIVLFGEDTQIGASNE